MPNYGWNSYLFKSNLVYELYITQCHEITNKIDKFYTMSSHYHDLILSAYDDIPKI